MQLLNKLRITTKFIVWFLLISLLPLTLSIYVSYNRSREVLKEEVTKSLAAVADNKANQIEAFLINQEKNAVTLSYKSEVISAFEKLDSVLRQSQIDSAGYKSTEREFKPMLGYYQKLFGYDDIFFVNAEGNLIFSTEGIRDINSLYGLASYTDSGLADVLAKAKDSQETAVSNLQYYPQAEKAAVFIATPLFEGANFVGSVVVQIGTNGIHEFVKDYTGLGETGETIIVSKIGNQAVFITPVRFDPEAEFKRKIDIGTIEAMDLKKALQGERGSGITVNYRNQEVLSVLRYLPTFQLGMAVTMDTKEVFATAGKLRNTLLRITFALILVVVIMAILIASSIASPIRGLTQITKTISAGNFSARAEINVEDEIGELAQSFNQMTDSLVEAKENVEQKKAELEEQKKLLEATNKELDSFVYTVSHDLRAPLRGIDGLAKFLEEDYANKLDKQGKDYLDKIRSGANHMKELIDDLLTLSRISRIKNPYEDVNMQELIASVINRIEFDIKQNKVELKMAQNLPVVRCDKIKVAEVFLNLINNAIKFSSKNKEASPKVEIGYRYDSENAAHEFYVKDNGIGIAPKDHRRIFEMFQRAKVVKGEEGTGLGLAIVQRIVSDHGGTVWVESEKGRGATFYFTVPKNLTPDKQP